MLYIYGKGAKDKLGTMPSCLLKSAYDDSSENLGSVITGGSCIVVATMSIAGSYSLYSLILHQMASNTYKCHLKINYIAVFMHMSIYSNNNAVHVYIYSHNHTYKPFLFTLAT